MVSGRTRIAGILDKIIIFSLYALAYFFPISKAIIEITTTLAIVCFILKMILLRENIKIDYLSLSIFAYLTICFFSIFFSSNFQISYKAFIGKVMQRILLFFVMAKTLNSERRVRNFVYIFLTSSLLMGIDGIYQHFSHKDFIRNRPYYGLPRIHATFPTPNDFGCYLVTAITFAMACFFAKLNSRPFRFVFAGLFALLFLCIMLTVSRGAWFAFTAAILFISIWIRSLGVFFMVLGICIIATQQFYSPFLKGRLHSFFVFGDNSSIDRKAIWHVAWKMFISKPWLGLGLGTFMFNFNKFSDGTYQYGVPYAHNCYLQVAAETGLVGLIIFLSIIVLFFYLGSRSLNSIKGHKTFSWYVLLASLAALLGYSVQMGVDTIFYSLDLGLMFWMLLGLGAAAMDNIRLEASNY
jgi:putative inorganic carbon (HCO3(-)) transporter